MTAFRETNFRFKSRQRIELMQEIIRDYDEQGLRLTARPLYYQFVSRNVIDNTERSYKNLTALLTDARYAGLVAWSAIEDRGREPTQWREYASLGECVDSALRNYRLQRWNDQPNYAELWVEKQALAGVLEPLAAEFHCTLMVNKGYSSASAMWESAQRFIAHNRNDQVAHLFYVGDHDPSGEDMVRDIGERLREFGVRDLNMVKVALTMEQVEEHEPPPNPAKRSDSRFEKYSELHGDESWEVDALPPQVLQQLIRDQLESVLDRKAWEKTIEREERDKAKLKKAVKGIESK